MFKTLHKFSELVIVFFLLIFLFNPTSANESLDSNSLENNNSIQEINSTNIEVDNNPTENLNVNENHISKEEVSEDSQENIKESLENIPEEGIDLEENDIPKQEDFIKCENGKIVCPDKGTPVCEALGKFPLCVGSALSCCKNINGGLDCREFGETLAEYAKKKILCDGTNIFSGIENVLIGDFNNDESKDLFFRVKNTNELFVAVFNREERTFKSYSFGKWSHNTEWTDVFVGDYDGDGYKDDIAFRSVSSGEWWVSISDGKTFSNVIFGKWPKGFKWVDVQSADFNGDNIDDVAGRDEISGTWFISLSDKKSFKNKDYGQWNPKIKWTGVRTGDFNGDGKKEIIGFNNATGDVILSEAHDDKFLSKSFGNANLIFSLDKIKVKDFNGDGLDDLIGYKKNNGEWLLLKSDGSSFKVEKLGTWDTKYNWEDVLIGKFNNDKFDDIVGRLKINSFGWLMVSEYDGKKLNNKFYGGPSVDLSSGLEINNFWKWPPHAGLEDTIAIDFDDDGIDDLAARIPGTKNWIFLTIENNEEKLITGDNSIQ